MATLNRRDFLKAVGVGSSAAAAGCYTYDPKVPQEYVLPYVNNPEDLLAGTPNYYASVCTGCANACGTVVRAKEGRAVFVEGNPDHPHGPGLCTRGHYGLLETYGPDRVAGPTNGGKATTWDEAQKAIVDAITAAKAAGKKVAWLGQYRTGSLASLLDEVGVVSGLSRVHWEPLGVETLVAASKLAFGSDALPSYVLDGAHVILSFGMDFLGTAFDSMRMIKGWAEAKDPAHDKFVTRYVAIEPRIGVTSSQADHWFAPAPGTEARVAMAIAKLAKEKKGYSKPAGALVDQVDVAAVAKASGIGEEKLQEIAGWITEHPSVILPGGHANTGADATLLAYATLLLNDICGNLGTSVQLGTSARPGIVSAYSDVKALLADAKAGNVGVLFLDSANPVYALPAEAEAKAALEAVGLLVQFANEADDSTIPTKTLLLPPGTTVETWGDAQVHAGVHVLQQPAMNRLKDSKSLGDVLLGIAKALPPVETLVAPRFAQADSWLNYVRARWQQQVHPLAADGSDFESFWRSSLQRGGYFQVVAGTGGELLPIPTPAEAEAPTGEGMNLVVFPSPNLGDGRHANIPWAQELPDPISTFFWTSWVELHPNTVTRLGLAPTDLVELKTSKGSVKLGFFGSPGVPEDTVALIGGNGHVGMGRYATGRGVNPATLLTERVDAQSGALATYGGKATVSRAGGDSGVLPLSGNMDQDGRPIAIVCNADDAVKGQGGKTSSLAYQHEPPVDPRVEEAGPVDMYPEPQHPTYRFAMAIDTNACNGCGACIIACALENNTPFVGPDQTRKGRTMTWIRMDRFWEGEGEKQDVRYLPAICQQCSHAPCEGVCPVLATYHNLDGLNAMIYNRCVGTRYCANNCPYAARRFNFHTFQWPESYHLMLNPDIIVREMGVMEKCTFCAHRLRAEKDTWRDVGQEVPNSALRKVTACASACPSEAITFGNWKDTEGDVRKKGEDPRAYTLLALLNTKPGVRYLSRARHGIEVAGHGGHGGGEHGGGEEHGKEGGEHGAAEHKEG